MTPFRLRPLSYEDIDALVKHADNPKIAKNLMDRFPHPYTREEGFKFIETALKHSPSHILAIAELKTNQLIGAVGVHPQEDIFKKNAELGIWLGEEYWGQGIGRAAVLQIIDHGFKSFSIDRIFARVYGSNTASQRLMESAGLVLEGRFEKTLYKMDQYEDEFIYAIRRS